MSSFLSVEEEELLFALFLAPASRLVWLLEPVSTRAWYLELEHRKGLFQEPAYSLEGRPVADLEQELEPAGTVVAGTTVVGTVVVDTAEADKAAGTPAVVAVVVEAVDNPVADNPEHLAVAEEAGSPVGRLVGTAAEAEQVAGAGFAGSVGYHTEASELEQGISIFLLL